jgi:molybdopterin/thiamine biosynthesis adenylyltransferase
MREIKCVQVPFISASCTIYRLLPKKQSKEFYQERTDRNIGWISPEEQDMLKHSVVAIAGCGGMGGLVAATLLRLGIGEIRIADTETFDVSNLNRQFAATKKTIGKSKALETARCLRAIADDTTIVVYPQGITEETVNHFVGGADLICDEIEFWAVGARILLHQAMRKEGSVIFNAPTVGHRVYLTKFTPDSLTMEEVLGMSYQEAVYLEKQISTKLATKEEKERVMNSMLRLVAPEEIPEYSLNPSLYSTVEEIKRRLREESKASIIATNPPLASGFLANHVLYYLLNKFNIIPRNYINPPPSPGYLMVDAGLLICKKETL